MGLVPDIEREMVNHKGISRKAEELFRNPRLEYLTMAVILMSTIVSGLTINHRATNLTRDTPDVFYCLDIVCFIYFSFEIILRLIAFHRHFFTVFGWAWNIFDLTLVILQSFEEVMVLFDLGEHPHLGWSGLRICRVLRSVRCIRMMKFTLYSTELKLLASCIVHSFSSFCWATLFLSFFIYIIGVFLTDNLVSTRIERHDARGDELVVLSEFFGSVPRSWMSLLQALTGGMDWDILVRSLDKASPWFSFLFILYILFGYLAVLNVVTGLFVNGAMERSQAVNDMQRLFQIHKLFFALDADASNQIGEDELMEHINDDAVQEFLNCVDMDQHEVHLLFDILDKDGGGNIDFEEFANGMLRMHGTASAKDLLLINQEFRSFFRDIQHESSFRFGHRFLLRLSRVRT